MSVSARTNGELARLLVNVSPSAWSPDIRAGRLTSEELAINFDDLHPPLSRKEALVEADRCYFCYDAPCLEACPTGIDIPGFIRGIQTDNVKGAATKILDANILGGSCARVCPTEVLCEGACVRNAQDGQAVKIGALQRYATDWLMDQGIQPFSRGPATGRRVAIVGAGPAGMACAHHLSRLGHEVTIFERRPKAGGLNEYGIAAYKVAHDFARREVAFLLALGGIDLREGQALGRDFTLADLRRDYDAVFLAVGLGGVNALGLPGEDLAGVIDAVDYIASLRQAADLQTLPIGNDVVVVGGGNTAIDIAIQARRLGAANVTIVYRRGPQQMSATAYEQELAQINGCTIRYWSAPVMLRGDDGHLRAVTLAATRLDETGGLVLTDERVDMVADQLFKAIGQTLLSDGLGPLSDCAPGKISVDTRLMTTMTGVFAGGDCIARDQDLTVVAVEDGKRAAAAIHDYLQATAPAASLPA